MKIFFAVILILFAIAGFFGISNPNDPVSDPSGSMIGFVTLFGLPGILLLVSDLRSRIHKTQPRKGHMILIFSFSIFVFSAALAVHAVTFSKPVIAKNAPPELTKMESCLSGNELVGDGLIAYRSKPVDIRVVYRKEITSINRYWYGSDAAVEIDGSGRFPGKPGLVNKSWDNTIHHMGNQVPNGDPKPYFEASIKLSPKALHRKLKLKTMMTVQYPRHVNGGFTNSSDALEKEFTVFVVTPKELIQSERIHDYRERGVTGQGFLIFGLCSLAVMGFVIWKRRNGWV